MALELRLSPVAYQGFRVHALETGHRQKLPRMHRRTMNAEAEREFLKERLRAISSRLSRRDRLSLADVQSLKREYEAIEETLKAMPRS